jgi:hypothetical protein
VLRKIFGPKRSEIIGGWRKLYDEGLRSLYPPPSVIRMIKSRMIRSGHVAHMERGGTGCWWEIKKERDH